MGLQIGVRGTGIERLIQHLFGPTGYLRKGTRNMGTSNLDRGVLEVHRTLHFVSWLSCLLFSRMTVSLTLTSHRRTSVPLSISNSLVKKLDGSMLSRETS